MTKIISDAEKSNAFTNQNLKDRKIISMEILVNKIYNVLYVPNKIIGIKENFLAIVLGTLPLIVASIYFFN